MKLKERVQESSPSGGGAAEQPPLRSTPELRLDAPKRPVNKVNPDFGDNEAHRLQKQRLIHRFVHISAKLVRQKKRMRVPPKTTGAEKNFYVW